MTFAAEGIDERVARAFVAACRAELEALKPGNVHRWSAGHGMTVADFEASAEAAAPAMAARGERLGARILGGVEATRERVGQNTNLGILLLAGPIAMAATDHPSAPVETATSQILEGTDRLDTQLVYRAIRTAAPGGLGRSSRHDVQTEPMVGLLEAMAEAADRDRIAWNYTHGFADVFAVGAPLLLELLGRGWPMAWAASGVYLELLAQIPDSHVGRKFGVGTAEAVRAEAGTLRDIVLTAGEPSSCLDRVLAFDAELKVRGLNPGTSADLTVACLFVTLLAGDRNQIAAP